MDVTRAPLGFTGIAVAGGKKAVAGVQCCSDNTHIHTHKCTHTKHSECQQAGVSVKVAAHFRKHLSDMPQQEVKPWAE